MQTDSTPKRRTYHRGDFIRVYDAMRGFVWAKVTKVQIRSGRAKLTCNELGAFDFDEAIVAGYERRPSMWRRRVN